MRSMVSPGLVAVAMSCSAEGAETCEEATQRALRADVAASTRCIPALEADVPDTGLLESCEQETHRVLALMRGAQPVCRREGKHEAEIAKSLGQLRESVALLHYWSRYKRGEVSREELDEIVSNDCHLASLEAFPVYTGAAGCLAETDPMDIPGVDMCLAKARNALGLIERAEKVCTGEDLTAVRESKALVLKQLPILEKTQAYHRGEVDAAELLKEMLKDE